MNKFFILVRLRGHLHTIVDTEGRMATFDTAEEVGNAIENTALCHAGEPLIFSTESANEHYPS